MSNDLVKLLEAFPDENWDWDELSCNPNITIEYIESHPEYKWDYNYLFANPNINIDYVLENIERVNWFHVTKNPGIKMEDIDNNPDLPWRSSMLGLNPNITMDFILKHKDTYFSNEDNRQTLGGTPKITADNIKKYPELFCNNCEISKNPNLTIDFAKKLLFWSPILYVEFMTFEEVLNYPKYLDETLFMKGLSMNNKITLNNYLEYRDKPWNILNLLKNPAISLDDAKVINDNKGDFNWNISGNPNLTFDYVNSKIFSDVKSPIQRTFSLDLAYPIISNNFYDEIRLLPLDANEIIKRNNSYKNKIKHLHHTPFNFGKDGISSNKFKYDPFFDNDSICYL